MIRDARTFFWVGCHPGLDLVNTEAVDARGDRLELVAGVGRSRRLGRDGRTDRSRPSRPVPSGARPSRAPVPAWFRRLRSALRHVLETGGDELSAARDLDTAVATVAVRLSYQPGHRGALPVDASVAARTAQADARHHRPRRHATRSAHVRRCGSQRCVLLFYDTSKNCSWRWCDMAVCGNRAKASSYYRRHAPHRAPVRRNDRAQ